MLSAEFRDEPSMEDILEGVRRILAAEETAKRNAKPEPLLLTDMIAADGTVVSIAPETKAYAAIRPMVPPRDCERDTFGSRAPNLVEAASSRPVPKRYSARLSAEGGQTAVAPLAESASGANMPAAPAVYIERMLAHQMAAAHETAMMLSSAAVEQMRAGGVGTDESIRLADSAARMMEAYNTALTTLMSLGGEAARSVAAHRADGEPRRALPDGRRTAGAGLPQPAKQRKRRAKAAGQPVHH